MTTTLYICCAQSLDLRNPWMRCAKHGSTLCAGNPWIMLRLRNPRIARVECAWAVLFMPHGMCQLTTNDRSIMVDQAEFDEFITHSFVEKRKNGSRHYFIKKCSPALLVMLISRNIAKCVFWNVIDYE